VTDPRIAPVEDNLEAFVRSLAGGPTLTSGTEPDVVTYHSDRAFPLLNVITGAHFAPGQVESRAREVLAPFLDRGLPFLWWTTPSGHATELEPLLLALGMHVERVPGMHVGLDSPLDPRTPDGLEISAAEPGDPEVVDLMLEGFDIPAELATDFSAAFETLYADGLIHLVARADGRVVAGGSAFVSGDTVGLYNICTLAEARGRGIGYAVTAALMNAGRERGATQSVLHASEDGRPVYERLGFVEVCQVPQFVWLPDEHPA
jgi:GNAT superfamily N-acetyltransferase